MPGVPNSPSRDRESDNDYYFAGDFSLTIDSVLNYYGAYTPVGTVANNEESAERAFAGGDNDLRYHFNLPDDIQPTDLLTVGFKWISLDTGGHSDPRYGVEVYFNGVLVQPQIVVRPAQLGVAYTTPQFTAASVNAQVGAGYDNIVSLKGISYSGDGGGAWMGLDYVQLDKATQVIPPPIFPWSVGKADNDQPCTQQNPCNGGGENATFVQENGTVNPLPGSPNSPELDRQADNDYYFAGSYTGTIPSVVAKYGAYTPVGTVSANEEAVERALTTSKTEQRYHFNLPNEMLPTDRVSVSLAALSLDDSGGSPKFGMEVYFNGVKVQPELLITPSQLYQTITTPSFLLGDVNARTGSGADNIVTVKGISKSSEGGGDWMGLDYVKLDRNTLTVPAPVLPWSVGLDDDAQPLDGTGGGTNAVFTFGDGGSNDLPGSPFNETFPGDPDDDYYFAGVYTSVIPSNGSYTPVGSVFNNEEGIARGFDDPDNTSRIHFNLPSNVRPDDLLEITVDPLYLDDTAADPHYGLEIYFNNVLVQPLKVVRPADLNIAIKTARFTAGSVNAGVGPGYDNIITLKGTSYAAQGGGSSLGFDYIKLVAVPRIVFPWTVGLDDNNWPCNASSPCSGGGPTANFVQENGGISPLPGSPNSPIANQRSDNDYYFAGDYTTTIDSVTALYGAYTPVGSVLANEESAERAFAAADNDLRYHFNLPTTLNPDDELQVTFDAWNLDDPANPANTDLRYGAEVYFNGVLVQSQIVIRPAQLGIDYSTPPFTLASVNAKTGLGYDNIVSLKGYNYNSEGGGNWMGIDYIRLDPVPLKLLPPVLNGNQVTLNWTGTGKLQWAPTVTGPWSDVTPAPAPKPYSEAIVPGQNRFYRLQK